MKRFYFLYSCLLAAVTTYAQHPVRIKAAPDQLFDDNWRFVRDDPSGAEKPGFPDASWRMVHLPHDWAIEDLHEQAGPFDSSGFVPGGTAWYRKTFILPALTPEQTVDLRFEGVLNESEIWLNGHNMGSYSGAFTCSLTPFLATPGKENVLAVRVKGLPPAYYQYSGAGIYRHVHLLIQPPVHFINTVVTTPQVSRELATVQVNTVVTGSGPVPVIFRLLDAGRRIIAADTQQVMLNGNKTVATQTLTVHTPSLWSPSQPYRYIVELLLPQARLDIPVGIRQITVDAGNGFTINGQRLRLKGAYLSPDNGLLGAATFDYAEIRKIKLLKVRGFNAIRTVPSEELLQACDSLGMLVVDRSESTLVSEMHASPDRQNQLPPAATPADITGATERAHQRGSGGVITMIRRDGNHPSVIMWDLGDMLPSKKLMSILRQLDSTRPFTANTQDDSALALLDVASYHYQWNNYYTDEKRVPARVMLGASTMPMQLPDAWNQVEGLRYVTGDFTWAAIDYLGDPGLGHSMYKANAPVHLPFPWITANCGDLDLIGDPRPQALYRDVVWRQEPVTMVVHTPVPDSCHEQISPWGWPDEQASWTWPGYIGKKMQVRVFSRANAVKLAINGHLVAARFIREGQYPLSAVFEIPYEPGVLQAFAFTDGKEVGHTTLVTAGKPAAIHLSTNRVQLSRSRGEIAYVHIDISDHEGNVVPNADLPLEITVSGEGTLIAAGNGSPDHPGSFQQPHCNTFRGRALTIVRANGEKGHIQVSVSSPGLEKGEISIQVE